MDICNSHSLSPSQGHSKTSLADSDIEGISSKKMSAINSNVSTMFNPLGNVNKPKVSNSSGKLDNLFFVYFTLYPFRLVASVNIIFNGQ